LRCRAAGPGRRPCPKPHCAIPDPWLLLQQALDPPHRGGNSPAQGNALGNRKAVIHRALKGQNSVRTCPDAMGSSSCALSGRGGFCGPHSRGVAPGCRIGAPSAPKWTVRCVDRGACISVCGPQIQGLYANVGFPGFALPRVTDIPPRILGCPKNAPRSSARHGPLARPQSLWPARYLGFPSHPSATLRVGTVPRQKGCPPVRRILN